MADLEAIARRWQRALDAAEHAVGRCDRALAPADVRARQHDLAVERQETARVLAGIARLTGVDPPPWLPRTEVTPPMLGLPPGARACLFDLDGVLTDSGAVHAWAWGEVLDDVLLELSERLGRQFVPFDREAEYREFFDGRTRLEGLEAFLAARGLSLPHGRADDPPDARTEHGLAARKGALLAGALSREAVHALPGAHHYVEAAGYAGLGRAVVSASTNASPMLRVAGLAPLVEARVDAEAMRAEHLRSRPAPDLLLAACRRLGVAPADAVTLTHSRAGVAAGRAAGLEVVGVGTGERAELLRGFGAERVVPSLGALLDTRLAA
jgi:HAD superfamily hydrolase (TIGR01509 family)